MNEPAIETAAHGDDDETYIRTLWERLVKKYGEQGLYELMGYVRIGQITAQPAERTAGEMREGVEG